jgi:hypothetical protein
MSIQESDSNPFNNYAEMGSVESQDSIEGQGGPEMPVWGLGDYEQLTKLVGATFSNESSYEIPHGVVNSSSSPFNNRHWFTDSEDEESISGSGGGTMSVWTLSRKEKLSKLAGGSFDNQSSFSVPTGIVDSSSNPFNSGFPEGEMVSGTSASGLALNPDGSPISGTAILEVGGVVIEEKDVVGDFFLTSIPSPGVTLGTSKDVVQSYDFRFVPSFTALDYFVDDIPSEYDAGSIKYGAIEGIIRDYEGNPVEGAVVTGQGNAASSNSDGRYSFKAPGGTEVTLNAVGTSVTRTPSAGSTLLEDFQFSRLEVEVVTPTLDPVKGMKVKIGSETHRTDENGRVVLEQAPVSEYEILISDYLLINTEIQDQGVLLQERVGSDDKAGVKVELVDSETGEIIKNLPATFTNKGLRAISNKDGKLSIFTDDAGEVKLSIGQSDRRYKENEYGLDLDIGDTVKDSIEMDRKKQVSGQ